VSKQFWIVLPAGLAVVGALLFAVFSGTKGAHVDLQGEILKVRVLSLNPQASLVVADFRVTNPSDIPFVVSTIVMQLDRYGAGTTDGTVISKPDMENVFKFEKLIGPKYNEVMSIQDKVAPHQKVDRMAGARFELSEAAINARKGVHLHIEDVDGAVVDIGEKK
jgi:hypothetical protein